MATQQAKTKYDLPLRFRFAVWIVGVVTKPCYALTDEEVVKSRVPFPIQFLADLALGRRRPLHEVTERLIPVRDSEIAIRIYRPSSEPGLPIIVYYHGGGWMRGSLWQSDPICRNLSAGSQAIVVSVDYRLAPEFRFPTQANDAFDALLWVHKNASELAGDANRIGVVGDSSGGNLAAVAAMMSRDFKGPEIALQCLVYPPTNGRLDFPSVEIHAHAPLFTRKDCFYYREQYEGKPGDHLSPYFSPYLAENHRDLAPAFIVTAGYDPLSDDGERYADRLREAGNDVAFIKYEKETHGFLSLIDHARKGNEAMAEMCAAFRKAFS